jgi:hypothetical protein
MATRKLNTKGRTEDKYKGNYPSVFKKVEQSDFKKQQFVTNKLFTFLSGSATSSALPLEARYTDRNFLPALGSELTFNDAANIDGSLQSVTYFSIDHLYYRRKDQPSKTFGPTDLTRTKKHLYESASVFVIPQLKIGEGIKPASFQFTVLEETVITVDNTVYGIGTSFPLLSSADLIVSGNIYDVTQRLSPTELSLRDAAQFNTNAFVLNWDYSSSVSYDSSGYTLTIGTSSILSEEKSGLFQTSDGTWVDLSTITIDVSNITTNVSSVTLFGKLNDPTIDPDGDPSGILFNSALEPVASIDVTVTVVDSVAIITVDAADGGIDEEIFGSGDPPSLFFTNVFENVTTYTPTTSVTSSGALPELFYHSGSLTVTSPTTQTFDIVSYSADRTRFTIDTPYSSTGSGYQNWSIDYIDTGSYSTGTVYAGTSTLTQFGLNLSADRYGNIIDDGISTDSIVTDVQFYEGFNEYFDTSRISFISESGVTYLSGVPTTDGDTAAIGRRAHFEGAGHIQSALPGYYDRQHDYAISFFVSGSNTGSNNQIVIAKQSGSVDRYPFSIQLSGSNEIEFKVSSNSSLNTTLSATSSVDEWTHIVCQKSGSEIQIWMNAGLHVSSSHDFLLYGVNTLYTTSGRINNDYPLNIGGLSPNTSNLTGDLDEIRIFNKSLTESEISALSDRTENGTFLQTNHVGNVFSKHGTIVISSPHYKYDDLTAAPFTSSYRSTVTTTEYSTLVRISKDDFNLTLNPSTLQDNGVDYDTYVSSSDFAPYITTIGLYNESGQLLVTGKLASPVRKRDDVDMNILLRFDADI